MSARVALLATGSELLSGELSDRHAATLARALRPLGLTLAEVRLVPDDPAAIAAALRDLARGYPAVVVTGGLGPTRDDLTAAAAARAFDREVVRHPEAERLIAAFFAARGRVLPEGNARQADLPAGAEPIPNPLGSAPGFTLDVAGAALFFLPGVPDEMERMLGEAVLPQLARRVLTGPPLEQRILRVLGLAEAEIERRLAGLALPAGTTLGYGLDFPCVLIKLSPAPGTPAAALDPALALIRERLADALALLEGESLPQAVARRLTVGGMTLALAESCTGGLVAALLTDLPGASAFFERGAVTYADRAKQDWLGVPAETLATHGAVSEACARAMAEGVRRAAGTDLGLSLTGIAGPGGGTAEKPVGTVWMGLAAADGTVAWRWQLAGRRDQVRTTAAMRALAMLLRRLDPGGVDGR